MTNNYFVVQRPAHKFDHRESMSRYYFFDSDDRESIETALRKVQADSDRAGRVRDDQSSMFGHRRHPIAVWRSVFCSSPDPVPVVGESTGRFGVV